MMNFTIFDKKEKKLYVVSILFWIGMWQILASFVNQEILFVSPISVLIQLFHMIQIKETWMIVMRSTIGIMIGFSFAFFYGFFLALFSYRFQIIKIWIEPVLLGIKSIPVASCILVLFLFLSAKLLPVTIVFLMVLPIAYTNFLQGFCSISFELLEMAKVFKVRTLKKWRYLYSSELFPAVKTICTIGIGFAWKSGVAAEVIGMCQGTIGQALYEAKIYFDTVFLFAWTIIILFVSLLWEKMIHKLFEEIEKMVLRPIKQQKDIYFVGIDTKNEQKEGKEIQIKNLTKRYKEQVILEQYSVTIPLSKRIGLEGRSGAGKTTFLRCMLGLEPISSGMITGTENIRFSVVFQENRLCENLSVVANIQLVSNISVEELKQELQKVGLFDVEHKKVKELSGGMKRRIAIIRALQVPFDVLVLDEPFQGLDQQSKEQTIAYIMEKTRRKTVLVVSHEKEDLEKLEVENRIKL